MMKQLTARYSLPSIFILALCFVLAACGSSASGSSTSSAPAATPTFAPTPTPKPSPTDTISTVYLTTVTGDGYTIGYPSGWMSKKSSVASVSVLLITRDASGSTTFIAESVAGSSAVSTTGSVQGALNGFQGQVKNFKMKSGVPATVTINGIQWDQGAATADSPAGVNTTVYVLSTKYPGNANKLVTLIYTAATSEFDKVNTEDFQPMLLSFKFM